MVAQTDDFVSVSIAVAGLVVTALGYIGYQGRRDRLASIHSAFDQVVALLAAEDRQRQLSGAVLLRRFFDETSEFGIRSRLPWRRRAPFANEALNVTAAVLRGSASGDLQKLLADGISFAPDLAGADLQRANLQNAYLPTRHKGATYRGADFFRADLTSASLKGADARGAVFMEARLIGTTFKGADLTDANFAGADLLGARFDEAVLTGATFSGAFNLPSVVVDGLDDEREKFIGTEVAVSSTKLRERSDTIFCSSPSMRSPVHDVVLLRLLAFLHEHGYKVETLPREQYVPSGQLTEVRRRLQSSAAAVICGLDSRGPSGTVSDDPGPCTPWVHLEAGIAFALNLPLLVIGSNDEVRGIFDAKIAERRVHSLSIDDDWSGAKAQDTLMAWLSDFERDLVDSVVDESDPGLRGRR